jgi:hypothetical protein
MDRAAKLAALAGLYLGAEMGLGAADPELARQVTRRRLAFDASNLGFSDLEISAAVDEALTAAGTTP